MQVTSFHKIIRYYYDEVFNCWVIYYRDAQGLVQRTTSLSRPSEAK